MIKLSREIRFSLCPPASSHPTNSWAGWPATDQIAPYLTLQCVVRGNPHPQTGYLCNIKLIDGLLRGIVTDRLIPEIRPGCSAASLLWTVYREALLRWKSDSVQSVDVRERNGAEIESISLAVSPHLFFEIKSDTSNMIQITQQFEFSASHRLHCHELTDQENRELFGKCNNPNGHGHNYVVAVTLRGELAADGESSALIPLNEFESTVKKLVVDRLDHKHLNEDIDYFARTIPSVENIAIAIWNWLEGNFGDSVLENVRVYETPKTWAEYGGV